MTRISISGAPCDGGGHLHVTVSVDGGATREMVLNTDDVMANVTADEDALKVILRFYAKGKTRTQVRTALNAGIVVVI